MCGIIASVGDGSVAKVLQGLYRLEYRGYDSCGIAFKKDDKIEAIKSVGYVESLHNKVPSDIVSNIAIGHTRWATHGGVTEENSHPHMSSSGRFAIVHNGILENYKELKGRYLSHVEFVSQTDSEVIAQLMDELFSGDVFETFKQVVSLLEGSFAIAMISSLDNRIYFARHRSPMVLGKNQNGYELASDIYGLSCSNQIYYVADDCMGYVDENVYIIDRNHNKVDIKYINKNMQGEMVGKAGYPHFMLKEIYEIPISLRNSYEYLSSIKIELPTQIDNILIIGCGTSYHSGLMGSKYIEEFSGIPCECIIASEFIYNKYICKPNTLGIFISQSGETADTLTAMKKAESLGIYTLAITNVESSSITRMSDATLFMKAGAEICVASTKAYTTQVFYLVILCNVLKYLKSKKIETKITQVDFGRLSNGLGLQDEHLQQLFSLDISAIEKEVDKCISKLNNIRELHIIGKGYDYITAMESALKIKEVSYIFTDAYPSGELKHGTLSLIDDNSWVISINTSEELMEKGNNAIHEIVSRGGRVIAVSNLRDELQGVEFVLEIPRVSKVFLPIVAIIPIDLIAYKLAVSRGNNPDKPRNLAKSVTVE